MVPVPHLLPIHPVTHAHAKENTPELTALIVNNVSFDIFRSEHFVVFLVSLGFLDGNQCHSIFDFDKFV